MPALVLPDGLKPRGLGMQPEEIAFDPPLPPSYPLQPAPPPYDKPVYGADWTGLKPFQVNTILRGHTLELWTFKSGSEVVQHMRHN